MLTKYCSIALWTLALRVVIVVDNAYVVKPMVLRKRLQILLLSSYIICLFLELRNTASRAKLRCDGQCSGHSESRVFDYFVPEFVLPSSNFY